MSTECHLLRLRVDELPENAAAAASSAAEEALRQILGDEFDESRKASGQDGGTAEAGAKDENEADSFWTLSSWFQSLNLNDVLAAALLSRIREVSDEPRVRTACFEPCHVSLRARPPTRSLARDGTCIHVQRIKKSTPTRNRAG